jgi:hypothetical protein
MGGYNYLAQIRDSIVRNALKILTDRVTALETQAADIGTLTKPLAMDLDAGSHKLTKVAPPTLDTDAVNLRYLKTYVDARLNAAGLTDAAGQAVQPQDSDNGQTAAGVAAAGPDGHPSGSDLTAYQAGLVIGGTAHEFPALVAPAPDQPTRDANQAELLSRIIWHLQQKGFTAGKQRNPSGIVSGDKIALIEDGQLRAFDIFTSPSFDAVLTVQAIQVSPANLVSDSGTAD